MPNKLINESSPYLLQHAHNPVDWYPWGEEALERAKKEDKPILVSIGYAACHWCHVMERESFENAETAAFMNEHFINIKIDREERPDLDHIYMDAVQAMTGSGGWPLNVFLTPDAQPFYGGTYFPPQPAYNRPSWIDVLRGVSDSFRNKREEIIAQAENLTAHIVNANDFGIRKPEAGSVFTNENTVLITGNILKTADKEWGGFGKAPKFPQTFPIRYLLRFYYQAKLENRDMSLAEQGLTQALLSLDKMIEGGIYDQLGGGFARYSTDSEWLAPHFEKMLYDNALLVSVLAEAYQLTGRPRYAEVIAETMLFLEREFTHPGGGWYAALDADSEGVEGRFYVWEKKEVDELLGEDAALFSSYYDITEKGNWEHRNIPRVRKSLEDFATEKNISTGELKRIIQSGKEKLLARRQQRIRPQLDDKIILGWNALMNSAVSKAFTATGREEYRRMAETNMEFLIRNFRVRTGALFLHTWKNGEAKFPSFLDDLAFLIRALIDLQEITGNSRWLREAEAITGEVIENFSDEEGTFFYFTGSSQSDVILRKKEVYDGALPSGNAMMAGNLVHLSLLLDRKDWQERGVTMVSSLVQAITKYPTSFGHWAGVLLEISSGVLEIAVTGPGSRGVSDALLREYIPHKVFQSGLTADSGYPLLAGKELAGNTGIWLCRNYTCTAPVFSVGELISLINRRSNE